LSQYSPDLYNKFICQKCFRYFPSKTFLKLHNKTIHSNERAPKEKATIEESAPKRRVTNEELNSNHEIRNVALQDQIFQGEKAAKKSKSRAKVPCQQNQMAKPWEQDHLTFKI